MLDSAPAVNATTIPVIDFRRRSMVLQWHAPAGTWTPCEFPPSQVFGIALINPTGLSICVFGQGGRLLLQIGPSVYALAENSPRIVCRGSWLLFGLRRRFIVRSSKGGLLYRHTYWRTKGRDFFRWFAQQAGDADWRTACGREWSEGVEPSSLPRQ